MNLESQVGVGTKLEIIIFLRPDSNGESNPCRGEKTGAVMISLKEIIEKLKVEPLSSNHSLDRQVTSGYASDLLSCVIKGAKKDSIWVTLQSHLNVVAVASLLGLSGVIITEGNRPDPETLARAENEGVVLMVTPKTTFTVVGELTSLGVKGEEKKGKAKGKSRLRLRTKESQDL